MAKSPQPSTFAAPLQCCPSRQGVAAITRSGLLPCWARRCLVCLLVLHWVPCGLGSLIRVEPPPPGQTRIASISLTDGAGLHSLPTADVLLHHSWSLRELFYGCFCPLVCLSCTGTTSHNHNLSFTLCMAPGRPNLALCPTRRHVNQTTSSSPATAREPADS